ncbi:MAG: DUF6089 family protein [Bacteroidota bacterium]
MLSRITLLCFVLLFSLSNGFAQKVNEVGAYVGLANYQGDFTRANLELGDTRYAVGALYRHHFNSKFTWRTNATLARLGGADENAENDRIREDRNWSFKSTLVEVSTGFEWMPFRKANYGDTGVYNPQLNPYLFAGIGYAVSSSSLSGNPSSRLQLNETGGNNDLLVVPFGGGVRLDFKERMSLAGELSWRYTGSDYVDGISAGKQETSDWYFLAGISFSYTLGEEALNK